MNKRTVVRRRPSNKKSAWDPGKWAHCCAWCARKIPANQKVFGIEISLRPEAFREFDCGTVQPLLLAAAGRTVAMLIMREHSPAKHEGKDAMFQLCSETCAVNLQQALRAEMSR